MANRSSNIIMQEVMMSGNIPVAGPGRNGMMGGGGGVIPPTLLEENRVPKFYREAISACGATHPNTLPNTALVYNMMVTSGLPRPVLSHVWSAVNRTLPGQLTRPEFFSCLALIALAQKGESLAALSSLSQLPVPQLQLNSSPSSAPVVSIPTTVATPVNAAQASTSRSFPLPQLPRIAQFVPSSLLPRKSNPAPNVDLLGDPVTPSTSSSTINTTTSSSTSSATTTTPSNESILMPTSTSGSSVSVEKETVSVEEPVPVKTEPNYDLINDIDWSSVKTCLGGSESPAANNHASEKKMNTTTRVLTAATQIFEEADSIFYSIKPTVAKEVFETERGSNYLRCLEILSDLIGRIVKSSVTSDQKKLVTKCNKIWQKFSPFLKDSSCAQGELSESTCPICHSAICSSQLLIFGGRSFHSSCANLWVNRVDSVLP